MTSDPEPYTHPGADYPTRLPMSIRDAGLDSDGNPDPTSQDRRWLWRLEMFMSVSGTNPQHQQMAADLKYYLGETCEHHWKPYAGDDQIAAHRQCSWCNDVEWAEAKFEPGWLQEQVARSVATMDSLPGGLRRSIRGPEATP